ncbi:ferritin-like fold-containing protein [Catenulispora pinisilvae]|uniref:ferritin-like fold-containing protein n=1 Tax=Catenulispora pinisilvae TaxID=2705253 RepID=UPI001E4CE98C|nr:ferritin-like fold-containing protein [Catenulispora pinisilvae]
MTSPATAMSYEVALTDFLGLVAYGELTAFERLAADSALAPTLDGKAQVAGMAAAEFDHFRRVRDRLAELGADPTEAMVPFAGPVDAFHEHTKPSGWLESLVKAYIGDTLTADFYREAARHLDPASRAVVEGVLEDLGHSAFVVEHVRAAIDADPKIAGRLALWGRRIMGEALTQAQHIAARRAALAALLAGMLAAPDCDTTVDLAEVGKMLTRLTEAHGARMATLGLSA